MYRTRSRLSKVTTDIELTAIQDAILATDDVKIQIQDRSHQLAAAYMKFSMGYK